jgi:hypothetical protein
VAWKIKHVIGFIITNASEAIFNSQVLFPPPAVTHLAATPTQKQHSSLMAYTPESLQAAYEKYDDMIKQAIFDGTIHQTMTDNNDGIVRRRSSRISLHH